MTYDETITEEDVRAFYRVFLNRQPDAEGLKFYEQYVGKWTIRQLIPYFAHSREFRDSEAYRLIVGGTGGAEPVLVELKHCEMYVLPDDPAVGEPLLTSGEYEPHVATEIRGALQPGMTFVDVGANVGYFSLLAASIVGERGTVVAIEPIATNAALIGLSAERNGFDNVDIWPVAVADRTQTIILDEASGTNAGIGGTLDDPAKLFERPLARTVPLDKLLAGLDRLDVMKIDIEGAEMLALRGAKCTIERYRPLILTEFSPALLRVVSGVDGDDYLALIDELGYDVTMLGAAGSDHRDIRCDPR